MQSVKTLPPSATAGATTNIFNIGIKTLNIYESTKPIFKVTTVNTNDQPSFNQPQHQQQQQQQPQKKDKSFQLSTQAQTFNHLETATVAGQLSLPQYQRQAANVPQKQRKNSITNKEEKKGSGRYRTNPYQERSGKSEQSISLLNSTNDVEMEDESNDRDAIQRDSIELPPVIQANKGNKQVVKNNQSKPENLFQIKKEQSHFISQFSSKVTNSTHASEPTISKEALLRTEERNYLNNYWKDYFHHMRSQERKSMCDEILKNHPEASKYLRAHFIDWIFHVHKCLRKEDDTLVFHTVCLFDRYYSIQTKSQNPQELQLNGVTSYFIISKVFEIEAVDIGTMIQDMCYNKYPESQFLAKETEILKILECEIETPHTLEFLLYYFKLIRLYVQEYTGQQLTEEMHKYLRHCEKIAKHFAKMTLVDMVLMSVKPSIMAAACIMFGIFSCFRNFQKDLKMGKQPMYHEQDLTTVRNSWNSIMTQLLTETNINEIEEFMKEISERLSFINHRFGKRLENIFKKHAASLLPPFQDEWFDKYRNII